MLKLLKNIIKIIEALLMLVVPLIFFYWFISLIDLDALRSVLTLFETVLNQPLAIIKSIIDIQIEDRGLIIDFSPVILGFVFMGASVSLCYIRKGIKKIELKYDELKLKKQREKQQQEMEEKQQKEIQDLKEHKVIYFILKLSKSDSPDSYLYNSEEDFFTQSIVNGLINGTAETAAKEYNAERYPDFEGKNNTFRFLFTDTRKAIGYAKFIKGRVIEINKEVLDQSMIVNYSVGCHCNYDKNNQEVDLDVTSKILALSGENEVTVSDVFKKKYEAEELEEGIQFAPKGTYLFDSKGICNINNDELEVFKIKID